jgi:hypothetical protein
VLSNNTLDSFEISGYLESQLKSVVKSQITTATTRLENTFNKYQNERKSKALSS